MHQILIILLVLMCLGILGYIFLSKKSKTEAVPDSQTTTAKFQGKIESFVVDCFLQGECSVILESNIVITVGDNPGDVSPKTNKRIRDTDTWGRLIGFNLLDEENIGKMVEVYAEDVGVFDNTHFYTLEGDSEYYIRLLNFNFSKTTHNNGSPEKFETYATERYEFEYPTDWAIEETSKEDKTFVEFYLKQNSASVGQIGKWLRIKVYYETEFPKPKLYSRDEVSGQLTIAGKKYDRFVLGSGLFIYTVEVKENGFMFEFSYNSLSAESTATKIIETIIQSLKFK